MAGKRASPSHQTEVRVCEEALQGVAPPSHDHSDYSNTIFYETKSSLDFPLTSILVSTSLSPATSACDLWFVHTCPVEPEHNLNPITQWIQTDIKSID